MAYPGHEGFYQRRMRIEHAAGNPAGMRRAYTELIDHLGDFNAAPGAETTELYNRLLARPSQSERSSA